MLLETVLSLFLPSRCLACRKVAEGQLFCTGCARFLEPAGPWCCRVCGRPRPQGADGPCLGCIRSRPPYTTLRAAYFYGGPMRDALLAFKHSERVEIGNRLARMLIEQLGPSLPAPPAVVVPVPLHRTRQWDRGYNQAVVLARRVANHMGAPLLSRLLKRVRDTGDQAGKNARERAENVAGAFALSSPRVVAGRKVILIDDVIASSATVSECARVLARGGAAEVHVRALARPPE